MLEDIKRKLQDGIPLRIVGFGDSLTYGWMVSKGYLEFLKELIVAKYQGSHITIINKGIPGNTAQEGVYRLSHDVLDLDPDCVLVQFALNDALTGYSTNQFRQAIENIVDRIKADTSSEVILLTSVSIQSPILNEIAEEFYSIISLIAEGKGIAVAHVHEYWKRKIAEGVPFKKLLQADQVHPTVEGYRLMAEAVMELL